MPIGRQVLWPLLLSLALVACRSPQQQPGQPPGIAKPAGTSAPSVGVMTPATTAADQPRQLNIATATVGGLYYPIGAAMAQLFTQKIPGVTAAAQATAGTPQNIDMLVRGEADLAIGQAGVMRDAYRGQGDFSGRPVQQLRAITYLYPNVVQFFARADSGVGRIPDFRGKRFVPGAIGSANEVNSREIFDAYGLDYRKNPPDVQVSYVEVNASIDLLKSRQVDGAQLVGGIPFGGLIDVWNSVEGLIVPIDEPDPLQQLLTKYPHYYAFTIPKGTYSQQVDDVRTVAIANLLFTRAELPEELAYQVTEVIHENVDRLAQAHNVARNIRLEDAQNGLTIPLHPGAERYYRERGVAIKPFQS